MQKLTRKKRTVPPAPSHLSDEAKAWWKRIHEANKIEDQGGLLLLQSALEAFARMRQAQDAIAADGLVIKDRWGQPRPHPAAVIERDSRAAMLSALRALALDIEPPKGIEMPRQYLRSKTRSSRELELPDAIEAYLLDDPIPSETDPFLKLALEFPTSGEKIWNGQTLEEVWNDFLADALETWIADWPGSRPKCWWRYSAPEPRRRLGGVGEACHERLAYTPWFEYGVPVSWIDRELAASLNPAGYPGGKAMDPPLVPIDADDPPSFESQATYLDRLGLFQPGERRRLGRANFSASVPLGEVAER